MSASLKLSVDIRIPAGYKYIAQNWKGDWYAYLRKPKKDLLFRQWSGDMITDFRLVMVQPGIIGINPKWKETLLNIAKWKQHSI